MELYPIEKCEVIDLPQGKIYLGHSDEKQSVGYLELNPGKALDKHNRPVDEKLVQIKGTSTMKFGEEEVILNKGDIIVIPANKFHVHANDSENVSITYWEFNGDIIEIINKIRSSK